MTYLLPHMCCIYDSVISIQLRFAKTQCAINIINVQQKQHWAQYGALWYSTRYIKVL